MDNAIDVKLYLEVKDDAKNRFEVYPSAYANMWLQKEYQRRGGKYYTDKPKTNNLKNWRTERWIQILPLLKNKKIVVCGDDNKETKACRPIVRVDKDTPITIQELLELHPVKDIIEVAEKKNKDMNGRVYWKTLKFSPSK